MSRRKTAADYEALATKRGFEWIGDLPTNVTTKKTLWRCPEGHEWAASYNKIQQGKGCPVCAGNIPKVAADYETLAAECGFEWLGDLPANTQTPTLWRCSEGHEWAVCYSSIQQGHGCPYCIDMVNGARVSAPQRELCDLLGGILNHPCGRRRIDVALTGPHIAVEYDCAYWHDRIDVKKEVKRDRELLRAGWKVLHIHTETGLPDSARLKKYLAILKETPAQALTMIV